MGDNFIVTNSGIYKTIKHEYGEEPRTMELIIPKEVFIEAYEKYIRDSDDLK